MINAGALKKEIKYTGIDDRTYYIRTNRSSKDKFLLFHLDSLDLLRSNKGFQKFSSRDITTNRKTQVKEKCKTSFAIENCRSLNQPGIRHVNTNMHAFMKIDLKTEIASEKMEQSLQKSDISPTFISY